MISYNDTILIQTLTGSFRRQLAIYVQLRDVVRQLMSKLVLSRGDLSPVTGSFQRKKELIDAIENERNTVSDHIDQWQERKSDIRRTADVEQLEEVLQKVTDTVQEFLKDEDQLRTYIEGIISRNQTPASQ